jgi:hypothetical protein
MELNIFDNRHDPIKKQADGYYFVIEKFKYFFEITGDVECPPPSGRLILDSVEELDGTPRTINIADGKSSQCMLFQGCLGLFSLSFNGSVVAYCEIATDKLTHKDAEDLFTYLYQRSEKRLLQLLEQERLHGSGRPPQHEQPRLEGLLKTLAATEEFADELSRAMPRLAIKPYTRLRPVITDCPITSSAMGFKSTEWLLCNLDTLRSGGTASDYGRQIKIGMQQFVLEKVAADTNLASTKTYENEVILGALKRAMHEIGRIRKELDQNLAIRTQPSDYPGYATFDSIKRLIFEVEGKRMDAVQQQLGQLYSNLEHIFPHAEAKYEYPRLTHVFATEPTYRRLFTRLMEMLSCKFSPFARKLLLGIRNIQELYELYNFHRIFDALQECLGAPISTLITVDLKGSEIAFGEEDFSVTLLYQPIIPSVVSAKARRHAHNLVSLFSAGGLNPDYILVFNRDNRKHHAVLDAKYTTVKWLEETGDTAKEIAWKYGLGLATRDDKYQKAEYIWTLFPGESTNPGFREGVLVHNNSQQHYPIIGSIDSRPGNQEPLERTLRQMIDCFRSRMSPSAP